ncbi:MAG: tRNA 4-thiouridine(8) synthase ThiI [Candidatus Omnitrophica bacterium]|nr:tRNA 4-thiouridine(8) synthase ThiI [Candidatus Omnitrophota bacterium]
MTEPRQVRALGLLSGGLGSMLAVKVVQAQGIAVTGISFSTPFFGTAAAERAAARLGIALIVRNITAAHLNIVRHPLHGYGRTMNPCIDCHALMIRIAGQVRQEQNFDFIFTGEVLNERPMSQTRRALEIVADLSGCAEHLVRPLTAQCLPVSQPEKAGLIDREKLLNLQGRSRSGQIALAMQYGLTSYPNAAGGCLLTDKHFSARLRELMRVQPAAAEDDFRLLPLGRHYRLASGVKVIVGRDAQENSRLEQQAAPADTVVLSEAVPGPVCLVRASANAADIGAAAEICAAYSDAAEGDLCRITVRRNRQPAEYVTVAVRRSARLPRRIE